MCPVPSFTSFTKKNPAGLALCGVFVFHVGGTGASLHNGIFAACDSRAKPAPTLVYQLKRRKLTKPTPSINRANNTMPYWLSVGIPSKNTVLVMVQSLPLPTLTSNVPQSLSCSMAWSYTYSSTIHLVLGNAGITDDVNRISFNPVFQ